MPISINRSGNFALTIDWPEEWGMSDSIENFGLGLDQLLFQNPSFVVPENATPGQYSVWLRTTNQNGGLTSSLQIPISVYAGPQIITLEPDHGTVDAPVLLTGIGVPENDTYVVFENDTYASWALGSVIDGSTLSFKVPSLAIDAGCQCEVDLPAGIYNVRFSANGTWSNEMPFIVEDPQ